MNYFSSLLVVIVIGGLVQCCPEGEECTDITCEQGLLPSFDGSKCLPFVTEYNGVCSEDAQCQWLGANSVCNYVCTCTKGFRWFRGECRPFVGLGQQCDNDIDCFDGYDLQSLACVDNKCACSNEYYQRGDIDCRKIAQAENDTCALDIDCKAKDVSCNVGKCKNTSPRAGYLQPELEPSLAPYVGTPRTCDQSECSNIKNSQCYDETGTCVCSPGYFYNENGTQCIPELGVSSGCDIDADCTIVPGKCVSGVCYCRDYYVVEDGNRNCIKTISEHNWNCLSQEWCYALGQYSYCSSAGTCSCSQLADFDAINSLCKPNGIVPGADFCSSNNECKYITNGFCIDEVCGCRENYVLQGNTCIEADDFSDLDHDCNNQNGCFTINSECRDNKCQCKDNYVASPQRQCLLGIDRLGHDCDEKSQCVVQHSTCVQGHCDCEATHLPFGNICYEKKNYSSYCDNRRECFLSLGNSFQCRNRMCQCETGHTLRENKCSSSISAKGSIIIIVAIVMKSIFG